MLNKSLVKRRARKQKEAIQEYAIMVSCRKWAVRPVDSVQPDRLV